MKLFFKWLIPLKDIADVTFFSNRRIVSHMVPHKKIRQVLGSNQRYLVPEGIVLPLH